jgi:hypothetical protein
MKKSPTVVRPSAVESPRHLPLVGVIIEARTELFELAVRSVLQVLAAMLEEDRTALCGPAVLISLVVVITSYSEQGSSRPNSTADDGRADSV